MSKVQGIIINCDKERRNGVFNDVEIGVDHPIHSQGLVCPVLALVNMPLVIYRHTLQDRQRFDPGLDNQIATYLMIGKNGLAPFDWQQQVGTVTVIRKDGKPLTQEAIETLWMYNDMLLETFGDDPARAQRKMNEKDFRKFCESYKKERLTNGYKAFETMELPL